MHIDEIIVDGFKSYKVRTVIAGFDRKFNAITGLNGSGKSNILDAICFVLGISNLSQVRAGKLDELVYGHGQNGVTKATVTIVFDNSDRENSPVGYEEYAQITVTRQIAKGGRNKYLINGHTAQLSRVQNMFHSVQLNVNNPHFLIMQGRITKVINMKPPEVLGMIEEAAGTRMFEMKREAAVKTIEKKDAKVEEIRKVLVEEITPTLDKLRTERGQYMQFTASSAECERLERLVTAHDFCAARRACEQGGEALEELKAEHAAQLATIAELLAEQAAKEEEAGAAAAQGDAAGSAGARKLQAEAEQLGREVLTAHAAAGHKREAAQRELDAAREHRAAAAELERAAGARGAAEPLRARADALGAEHAAADAEQRKRQATYEAQLGVGADATANTLAAQEQQAASDAASAASEAKRAALRAQHLRAELVEAAHKVRAAKKEGDKGQAELTGLERAEAAARARLDALGHDDAVAAELGAQARVADARAVELRARADALGARAGGGAFRYARPDSTFDAARVKGTIAELVRVRDARMALALEVIAGGKLAHVVVRDDETAKLLISRGKLQRRTTFVPLNRVAARVLPPATLAAARKLVGDENVWSPLALLEHAADLAPAVAYAFGGALLCADAPTAKRLAFDRSVGVACVTLDGDLFSPTGTLTGGSRAPAGDGLLARAAALVAARAEADAAEAAARALGVRADAAAAAADEGARLAGELQLTQHAIALARERLGASAYGRLVAAHEALVAEAAACDAARDAAASAEAAATRTVAELRAAQAEFAADSGAQLSRLKAAIADGKKALAAKAKALDGAREALARAELATAASTDEAAALRAQAEGAERDGMALAAEADALAAAHALAAERHARLEAQLGSHRAQLRQHADAAAGARAAALALGKRVAERRLEAKKCEQRLQRARRDADAARGACDELRAAHAWISIDEPHFGRVGSDYDFAARDVSKAAERLRTLRREHEALSKRVNKKALAMFERAEAEHDELVRKQQIVCADKGKIEAVIAQLDKKKKEALEKTYAKVNADFGSIFGTLLPSSDAKLQPPAGQTIHDGLVIHVALGSVWKPSLLELSGGQRSLVALSLVLALLLFKPAPLYILDEVDAALDLSHTQNIGAMIRKHFRQSQFVVVSLKEGMFNNANVIFRTKFVDGASTVSRTVLSASEPTEGERGEGTVAGKAVTSKKRPADRAALTLAN
ncbi:hypothetical protein KFE25_010203 [Diacronema lutheri]|uniref:Structural maintenance of chromosomes protein n=1 Tax=Diacronema lutheri TaxID=2081491 RepID=A0A8J5XKS5_DIALT|nr:hypothetical protein KFE25_010203 [Diacronema lutheri]